MTKIYVSYTYFRNPSNSPFRPRLISTLQSSWKYFLAYLINNTNAKWLPHRKQLIMASKKPTSLYWSITHILRSIEICLSSPTNPSSRDSASNHRAPRARLVRLFRSYLQKSVQKALLSPQQNDATRTSFWVRWGNLAPSLCSRCGGSWSRFQSGLFDQILDGSGWIFLFGL